MTMSTILQHRDKTLAQAIGHEVRRRRRAANLSQAAIGSPFTRAFVCAVERGRAIPSIPALVVILRNLDVGLDEFFEGVQSEMTMQYTPTHADDNDSPPGGGR
jgi:transcriptional regulator with XRE-family HTH domain